MNVYIEGRRVDASAARRGEAEATRGVWAFVNDSDGEKGSAGTLRLKLLDSIKRLYLRTVGEQAQAHPSTQTSESG